MEKLTGLGIVSNAACFNLWEVRRTTSPGSFAGRSRGALCGGKKMRPAEALTGSHHLKSLRPLRHLGTSAASIPNHWICEQAVFAAGQLPLCAPCCPVTPRAADDVGKREAAPTLPASKMTCR